MFIAATQAHPSQKDTSRYVLPPVQLSDTADDFAPGKANTGASYNAAARDNATEKFVVMVAGAARNGSMQVTPQ